MPVQELTTPKDIHLTVDIHDPRETQEKVIYINFYDGIDPIRVNKFMQYVVQTIQEHQPTELYFLFSSNGGDVSAGFVLYNFLLSLRGKLKITIHNIGNVDSIANVIFMSGEKRFASPNASFLFHGISMNMGGPQSKTSLKEILSNLESMENRMADTISKHSELTLVEARQFFSQGEGKDVNFALQKGIIHEIREPSVPPESVHLMMNFV